MGLKKTIKMINIFEKLLYNLSFNNISIILIFGKKKKYNSKLT